MEKQSNGQNPNDPLKILEALGITSSKTKHQAHGKTVAEMEELRLTQANEEDNQTVPGNVDSSVKVKIHEQHLVHVYLEKETWEKGKKTSRGFIQKFYPRDFALMSKSTFEKGEKRRPRAAFGEYDVVKVVHNPDKKVSNKVQESVTPDAGKKLTEMSEDELRQKYFDVSGDMASDDTTAPQLIVMIEEALQNQL